jgi:hypothetical protein
MASLFPHVQGVLSRLLEWCGAGQGSKRSMMSMAFGASPRGKAGMNLLASPMEPAGALDIGLCAECESLYFWC